MTYPDFGLLVTPEQRAHLLREVKPLFEMEKAAEGYPETLENYLNEYAGYTEGLYWSLCSDFGVKPQFRPPGVEGVDYLWSED